MRSIPISRIRYGNLPWLLGLFAAFTAPNLNSTIALGQTLTPANPIGATIPATTFTLQLEEVIQLPNSAGGNNRFARVEQTSPLEDGSGRMITADQRGRVYTFTPGDSSPTLFFDFGANIANFANGNQQSGLRGFAFHPNAFGSPSDPGYRKMYTAHEITRTNPSENHRSVVSEWTLNAAGTGVVANSKRDLLSQSQPRGIIISASWVSIQISHQVMKTMAISTSRLAMVATT